MARKNENRSRSKTVSFYVTPLEHTEIMARIKLSGMPKGEYFIQSLLHQEITISLGKYHSERLGVEFRKLRETLEALTDTDDMADVVIECNALLNQMLSVISEDEK